jgi:hypothetical protein
MTKKIKYRDFPFEDAAAAMEDLVNEGLTVHQKFTCEACGQRLTMAIPNKIFETGGCDKCGHVTDIRKTGCNYLYIAKLGQGSPSRHH